MSVRPKTLCDCTRAVGGKPCDNAAVNVCLVCDRDICSSHTSSMLGGIHLLVEVRSGGETCAHSHKPPTNTCQSVELTGLCVDCLTQIQRSRALTERINASAAELLTTLQKILKAAFSEEALK